MIYQLDVFLKNKPGELMKALEWIARKKIQIMAHSVATIGDFGILKLIVKDPRETLKYLQKKNIMASISEALCIQVENKPGELYNISTILGKAQINIKFIYGFVLSKNNALQVLEVDPEQITKAKEILLSSNYNLISQDDLNRLFKSG